MVENTTIYGYKILWNNTIYGNGLKTLFSQKKLTVHCTLGAHFITKISMVVCKINIKIVDSKG